MRSPLPRNGSRGNAVPESEEFATARAQPAALAAERNLEFVTGKNAPVGFPAMNEGKSALELTGGEWARNDSGPIVDDFGNVSIGGKTFGGTGSSSSAQEGLASRLSSVASEGNAADLVRGFLAGAASGGATPAAPTDDGGFGAGAAIGAMPSQSRPPPRSNSPSSPATEPSSSSTGLLVVAALVLGALFFL